MKLKNINKSLNSAICAVFAIVLFYASSSYAAITACTPPAGYNKCLAVTESGSDQTIPAGLLPVGQSITAKVWGASGGSGAFTGNGYVYGGSGGYATGQFTATNQPLYVAVGQGGSAGNTAPYNAYGGGGKGSPTSYTGTGGGGLSGLFYTATPFASAATTDPLIVAGGGGGGSASYDTTEGGAGGGLVGGSALKVTSSLGNSATCNPANVIPATGGTQTAGGDVWHYPVAYAANTIGTPLAGKWLGGTGGDNPVGSGSGSSSGGGGGYYGGGGGVTSPSGAYSYCDDTAAAGGSGYLSSTYITGGSFITNVGIANPASAPNSADPNYVAGIAAPTKTADSVGANGLVVLLYNVPSVQITKTSFGGAGAFNFGVSGGITDVSSGTTDTLLSGSGTDTITTTASGTPLVSTKTFYGTRNTAATVSETSVPATWATSPLSVSCTDANAPANGNPATIPTALSGGSVTIAPAYMLDNAKINCAYVDVLSNASDMVPDLSGMPTTAKAGTPYNGTYTCTNTAPLANNPASIGATCAISTLPAGLTSTCSPVVPTTATLAVGGAITCTVTGTPTTVATYATTLTTGATNDVNGGTSTTLGNNKATTSIVVSAAPLLTTTKTASTTPLVVGVPASYTLKVQNTGTAATTAATTITDTIPTGLTIGTMPAGCSVSGQTVTCTVASLAINASSSFVIPITPTVALAGTNATNTAASSGGGDATCPAATHCNSAVTTPVAAPQLTLTKTASTLNLNVAGSYTLQVQNTGTLATNAVSTITDTIPAGLTLGTMPAGCSKAGQVVTCTIATNFAINATTSFVIPVTPTTAAGASVTNTAAVSGGGDTTCPAATHCNSSVGPTTINASDMIPDLSGMPATATSGVAYTGTYTCTNTASASVTGPATVGATCAIATLPAGLTSTCSPTVPTTGTLAIGAVITCTVTGTPTTATSYTTTLTTGATNDVNGGTGATGNNQVTKTIVVAPVPPAQIAVSKTSSKLSALSGDTFTFSIVAANTGGVASSATTTIVDTIPTGVTVTAVAAGTGFTCTPSSALPLVGNGSTSKVTCTKSTAIAAYTSNIPVATISVTKTNNTAITNTAQATVGSGCPAGASCTANATVDVTLVSDMSPSLSGMPTTATVGQPYSGTYTCTNSATATGAANTSVTCAISGLPAGLSSVCSPTVPTTNLAIGATITCTVSGSPTVAGNASLSLTTGATNDSNGGTTAGGNNSVSGVVIIVLPPQVSDMVPSFDNIPAATVGVAYSGAYSCTNTAPAAIVSATAGATCNLTNLPAGLTASCTPSVPTAAAVALGDSINCTISGTPTAAGSSTLNLQTGATNDVNGGATSGGNNTLTKSLIVTGTPQLTLTKTVSANPLTLGQAASYTLAVQNTGTAATSATSTVTDVIPTGLTIGTLPSGCTASGQTVTCTIATGLAAGASSSFVIPITPTAAAGSSVSNTANVSGGGDSSCPAATHCSSTAGPTPITAPVLTLTKTVSANPLTLGQAASYTLAVQNTGTAATSATSTVTDVIPTGLTIGTLPSGCTASGQTVTCTIATGLAAGASSSFVIPITPTAAAGSSVINIAYVNGGGDSSCPGGSGCSSTAGPTPITAPVLTLTKTVSANPLTLGQAASYTLAVQNTGTAATSATSTVTDVIPTGLTIGTLPSGCTASGQTVTCTIATGLAAGASSSFVIPITPTAAAGSSVSNTANVSGGGDSSCPAATHCSSTAGPTPITAPVLTLTKTVSANPLTLGQAASYTLAVQNTGTAATSATSTVTDVIPTGLTIGTLPSGCTASGQTVTCTIATGLAAGASSSFVIPITPTAAAGSSVSNTANVSGGGDSSCPGATHCSSTAGPTPITAPVLTLTKTVSANPLTLGQAASYTLAVQNTGTAATSATSTVTDVIPTGLTIGTLPSGCTASGQTVTCTIATGLAAGASSSFVIPITPTAAAGSSVSNTANVSGGGDSSCSGATHCSSTAGPTPITAPVLTLTKTVSANPLTLGQAASYTLAVQNTGTAATSATSTVTDVIPTGLTIGTLPSGCTASGQTVTCTIATGLAAGASSSFVIPITPTAAAGSSVSNTANVSGGGDSSCPGATHCSSTAGPTPITAPVLTLTKTVSANPLTLGQAASYTLAVQNTGTAATSATSTVTDVIPTGLTIGTLPSGCTASGQTVTCTIATGLAAGASSSFVIPITPTAAAGSSVSNTANVSGGGDSSCPAATHCSSTAGPTPITAPVLTLTKTVSANPLTLGQAASYTLAVQNTGTAATSATSTVTDVIPTGLTIGTLPSGCTASGQTVTCTIATGLAAGASSSFVIPITPTAAAGSSVSNTANVSGGGDSSCPGATHCSSTAGPTLIAQPAMTLTKTAGAPSSMAAGGTIGYTFHVVNTGNVILTALSITDPKLDAPASCAVTNLVPAASTTCTGTHTITQAEVNAGAVSNSASASGTPAAGTLTPPTSSVVTPITAAPAMTLTKTAGAPSSMAAGGTINYTFDVKNTGNVTITALSIVDPKLGAPASCAVTTLLPGASTTCTGTHTITQAEVNAGAVSNSASASGTPAAGTLTPPTSSVVTPITAAPAMTLTKTAGAPSSMAAGGTINYTFDVKNTGNVTITALSIVDPKLGAPASCAVTTLLPGASTTCTGTHTITQAEVNAGAVSNSASASGTPAAGTLTPPTSSVVTPITAAPAMTLTKTAGAPSSMAAGGTINYTFDVKNTGNVTITALSIVDPKLGAPASCAVTTLLPGASTTCTGTHTITQAEVDAGAVSNSASASGTPAAGTLTPPTSSVVTPITAAPAMTLTKTAGAPSSMAAGGTINYTFNVVNTGNVTITALSITDPKLGAPASCAVTTLLPGASTTCTGTHTITQAEVNAGAVSNSASASGTPAAGTLTPPTSSVVTPITAAPAMTLTKTAGAPSSMAAGGTINYTFNVVNTGNVTITALSITDPKLGAPASCAVTTLLPGASTTCTGTHTITQAEVDAGAVSNSASASGTPAAGTLTPPTSSVVTPITAAPAMTLTKTAGAPSSMAAGGTINYTFNVVNTGNVTITALSITDPKLGAPASCAATTLLPAASTTCTGTHTITQAEVDAGAVSNSASASGTPAAGTLTPPTSSVVTPITAAPAMTLTKTAGAPSSMAAGGTINYTFNVVNTGNVTITALSITDPKLGAPASCAATTLLPAASTTCTGTHTITQAEVDAGAVSNSASASGTPAAGTLTPPTSSVVTPITAAPAMTLTKTAGAPSSMAAGGTINYTFDVKNTGNVTITALSIVDPKLGAPASCAVTTLLPGASTTCTGTHTITQAEVDAGAVSNSASASGTPAAGTLTPPTSSVVTPITAAPAMTLTKTAGAPSSMAAGGTINYTFDVKNTGNVTITALSIVDPKLGAPASCAATTLLPAASTTCTGTHTITQAEVNAGAVSNSASASGTPAAGTLTPPTSSVVTPITAAPAMTLTKTAGAPSSMAAGGTINYTFDVKNTGNVTITALSIVDPKLGAPASCAATTLLPAASTTCTGTHTITQAEVNAGAVSNSASASGTPAAGTLTPPTSSVVTPITAAPAMTLTKTAGAPSSMAAGGTINYTFNVVNTGNVTITALSITDPKLGAPASCAATTLLPAASTTCTGTHTITQAEVNAGAVSNSASASGTPAAGTLTPPTSSVVTPITAAPAMTLTKTAGAPSSMAAGGTINYTFDVKNTGNVTITNISIVDAKLDAPASCAVTTLLPGASTTCTGTHTITQTDLNLGRVDNSATINATPTSGTLNAPTANTTSFVGTIHAGADTPSPVNGTSGGTIPAVISNDTLNGAPVTVGPSGNVTLTPGTITNPPAAGGITMNTDGTITVAPGTTPGTYSYPYTICSKANPTICDTTTVTVVVAAIHAGADTPSPVNGTSGGTIPAVISNDTLNGAPVTVGPSGNVTLTPGTITNPPAAGGITMNTDGTITVAPGTTPGTYSYPYTICSKANPTICDTTTVTVVVAAIHAGADTPSPVNGTSGGTIPAVISNDTLNGAPVTVGPSGNVTLTPGTITNPPAAGGITMNTDGTITVAPGTTPGTYSYPYTICSKANPTICDTTTVTVVVAAIHAGADTPSPVNGTSGGTIPAVISNDTLNGAPVTVGPSGNVTLTPGTITNPPAAGGITMNTDGTITVAPGTTPGTYSYPYTICSKANPTICDTTTVTVVVAAIHAGADTPSPVNGTSGGTIPAVISNDTLNGAPVTVGPSGNVTLTPGTITNPPAAGGITMNTDGTITVAPGTTPGTYSYPYTICSKANPTICDTTTVTVVVAAIHAGADTPSPVNGTSGGTIPAVISNDTLNGAPVTVGPSGNVTLTPGTITNPPAAGGITMNTDGTITVAPGTTPGTYSYPYTICSKANPTICDTTTVTVVVAAIHAGADTPSPVNGTSGGTIPAVISNDTLNGAPVTVGPSGNVTLTPGTITNPPAAGGITMNTDGTITVAPGTTPGTYSYPYTICSKANPTICDTTTVTVVVAAIHAGADTPSPVNGTSGGTIPAVISNDTLNGAPVTVGPSGNVTLTPGTITNPPAAGGITMNTDGTITVAPGTTPGTYSYPYTICSKANPTICDTTTVTVVVAAIHAGADTPSPVNGTSGGTIPAVISNDTLNGAPVTVGPSGNVTLTPGTITNPPAAGGITMNTDGTITVAPGTTPGTYSYPYTICSKANPTICDTTTVTVVVAAIHAGADTPSPVNGTSGGTIPAVISNDTLNGAPVTVGPSGNVTLTPGTITNPPAAGGITMNTDGTITVAPGTTPGTYSYPYTICSKANPTICDTTTVTVVITSLVNVTGNVFNDLNGLSDNSIEGVGTNAASSTLTAYLVDGAGKIVTKSPILASGGYSFANVSNGTYRVVLSNNNSSPIGAVAPSPSIPAGWTNIGEGLVNMSDGTPDGIISTVVVNGANVTDVNFGIAQLASLSGIVWQDVNHNRQYTNGETLVSNMLVEVLNEAGQLVGSAITDTNGAYIVNNLSPGVPYRVRFRDNVTGGVIFGTPTNNQNVANTVVGSTITDANGAKSIIDNNGAELKVTLVAGNNLANQSLPLDPSGVIYNAVTRQPVKGAIVTLASGGVAVPDKCLVGGINTQTTGAMGMYQFWLLNPVPTGCPGSATYTIQVMQPAGYLAPASTIIPATVGPLSPTQGGVDPVQTQSTAPATGEATTYYFSFNISLTGIPATSSSNVVNNHIPLDPAAAPVIFVMKSGNKTIAEIGDTIMYTVQAKLKADTVLSSAKLIDTLPAGFRYIPGTSTIKGSASIPDGIMVDPAGSPGPQLSFDIGTLTKDTVTLTYKVRVGVGAMQGDGINRVRGQSASAAGATSNTAEYKVKVMGGVFTNDACIAGKVFVDCNGNSIQDLGELGIPGVRLYIEDGTYFITDSEGKYSYCGISPRTHVIKADKGTLPVGSLLTITSNRNAGDANSLFLDVKNGELIRGDFAEGSCSNKVMEQVKARRTQGEVRAPETENNNGPTIKFEGKAPNYPQQGTDSANQPIVKPRGGVEHAN